jgi:hypothetical protein
MPDLELAAITKDAGTSVQAGVRSIWRGHATMQQSLAVKLVIKHALLMRD